MSDMRKAPSKGSRSETVTVRLDPKLRYFAEIAARKHRRTLSSFIEWAIEMSLAQVLLRESTELSESTTIGDEISNLWDVDEPDRFVRLALTYPELLTHEEQVLWKLLKENGLMWRGRYDQRTLEWTWTIDRASINEDMLRKYWGTFQAVAEGTESRANLPSWVRKSKPEAKSISLSKTPVDFSSDPDDEIPF